MMKRVVLFFLVIISHFSSLAQEMKTIVAKEKVLVGEPFAVKFELEVKPSDEKKIYPSFDSLLVFKVNNKSDQKDSSYFDIISNLDSRIEKIQGKIYWTSSYDVIGFEEGYFIIPPQEFKLNGEKVMSSPKMISLSLMTKKKDVDFYDIEESYTELPSPFYENMKQFVWWGLLVLVLIILGLLFYFFIYKKRSKEEEFFPEPVDFKTSAIAQLDELMKKELWEKEELKTHFTEISFIARRYLSKETKQSFMEKTSLETQLILRKKGVHENQLKPLGLILNVSDMVKFAQSSLEREGIWSVYQETKKFIEDFNVR